MFVTDGRNQLGDICNFCARQAAVAHRPSARKKFIPVAKCNLAVTGQNDQRTLIPPLGRKFPLFFNHSLLPVFTLDGWPMADQPVINPWRSPATQQHGQQPAGSADHVAAPEYANVFWELVQGISSCGFMVLRLRLWYLICMVRSSAA